jgi:hypothetical protein
MLGNGSPATPIITPQLNTIMSGTGIRLINVGVDHTHFIIGNDLYAAGYQNTGEGILGFTTVAGTQQPTISTLANVAGNVGMVTGGYDTVWMLDKDGKVVYGVGYNSAANREFGSAAATGNSTSAVVPWSFTPPPAP